MKLNKKRIKSMKELGKTLLLTIRQICRINVLMNFKDYQGREIQLENEEWVHIQDGHPEITLDDIKETLAFPDEVRQSSQNMNVELYYLLKSSGSKVRYKNVVVKILEGGCFISTAMTTAVMKTGKTLFKKG